MSKEVKHHKVTSIPAGPYNPNDIYFLWQGGRVERWVVDKDGITIKKDAPFLESDISDLDKYTKAEVDAIASAIFNPAIDGHYLDITALIADQNAQEDGAIYFVDDASDDPAVGSGYAYYEYLDTLAGDLTDYRKMSAEENSAVPPNIAFTDQANIFPNEQTIKDVALIDSGGTVRGRIAAFVSGLQIRWMSGATILNNLVLTATNFYTSPGNNTDLGADNTRWKAGWFTALVMALGIKTPDDDPNKLLRSDGSVAGVTYIVDCEDSIYLDNILGTLSNMVTPNAETSYDLYAAVIGASHRVKINAPSQPTFTSDATQIPGSDFEAGVDMYMVVWYNGDVYEYWFEAIVIA